jgi:hypothetical protein
MARTRASAIHDRLVEEIGGDTEVALRRIVTDAVQKRTSIRKAVERLIDEMGRSGRTLILDETSFGLDVPLATLRYTVQQVPAGWSDERIKNELLGGCVLVTENGKDFAKPADMAKYRYGVIWLVSKGDDNAKADRVRKAMMTANFYANLIQVVKV